LLSGGPPFRGDHLWDIYQAHFSMDAGPLNLVRPEVPVELAAVVAKTMAKEPERRFQTPAEVARALTPFFKSASSQTARPSTEMPRVDTQSTSTQPSSAVPASSQPATLAADSVPAGQRLPKTGADGVAWESLIAIKEDGALIDAAKPKPVEPKPARALGPFGRPPWKSWPVTAAVTLFSLVMLGIIITIRIINGDPKITVELELDGFSVGQKSKKGS
jgi:hypothetical protein